MQGLDEILGSSGVDVETLGARYGLTAEQTRSAMGSLMPAVLGGFQKKTGSGDLDAAMSGVTRPETAVGNDILSHIFGSKDVSRQVADHAAGQFGVPSTVLKAMLPIVAAMAAKHFATGANGGGGGLGGMLGSILSGSGGLGGASGANPLDQILARMR